MAVTQIAYSFSVEGFVEWPYKQICQQHKKVDHKSTNDEHTGDKCMSQKKRLEP